MQSINCMAWCADRDHRYDNTVQGRYRYRNGSYVPAPLIQSITDHDLRLHGLLPYAAKYR